MMRYEEIEAILLEGHRYMSQDKKRKYSLWPSFFPLTLTTLKREDIKRLDILSLTIIILFVLSRGYLFLSHFVAINIFTTTCSLMSSLQECEGIRCLPC